jgi:excisionase family DNA binding protein
MVRDTNREGREKSMNTENTSYIKKYLSQIEASKYLGLSKSTVLLLTSRGSLAHYRVGRAVRYTVKDLDIFMDLCEILSACKDSRVGK